MKICENCRKVIKTKSESYFKVTTYEEGLKVKEGTVHKSCQDLAQKSVIQQKQTLDKAERLLEGAKGMLKQMGMEEVVTIE